MPATRHATCIKGLLTPNVSWNTNPIQLPHLLDRSRPAPTAMATSKAPALPAVLIACLLLSVVTHGCLVTIANKCPYPVTACVQSQGSPVARYQLYALDQVTLDLGSTCQWPSSSVYASAGGNCDDSNLANIAEFSLGSDLGIDFYDLTNVNGYTIGLQIIAKRGGCKSPLCSIADIRAFCQGTINRLESFPTGALSCHNTDGGIRYATYNNRRFKQACPDAYSYSFDDAASTWTCANGTDYQVNFC